MSDLTSTEVRKMMKQIIGYAESLPTSFEQRAAHIKAKDLKWWLNAAVKEDDADAEPERDRTQD